MTTSVNDSPANDASDATPTGPHRHGPRCYWDVHQARWSCASAAVPDDLVGASSDRPLVDVRDMLVVHTALLRELRLAPADVLAVAPGDRRRATLVAGHVRFLTDLLHHHHEGEDLLLWPVLRARASARAGSLIDEVEEQHADLDAELACVGRFREAWSDDPTRAARDRLVQHLEHLHALLRDHLDLEERALLPLAATLLSQAEWDAVGEAGAAALPKRDLPLLFGMFAYEGDPAVLAQMLHAAPPLARLVIPPVAARVYARRARRVHGTARP